MIEDLKPYPEYKDSGLPWLGEVPVHWEIRRNGGLFQQRNDSGDNELPILEVSLRTGVRVRDFATSKRKQVMTNRSKYKQAAQGDLVYNMMRMWQGAAGIAPVSGLVSPAYVVCRALPGIDSGYFSRLFKTVGYLAEIDSASRGIVKDRNRLYWDQFKQICSPLPPTSEQAAIARFLAWATNRLDRAIGAKRRIITLLQEQKQAIIHRAVMQGLDPSVPLKDSGIPWLGEIPEHWEVRRLKYLTEGIQMGPFGASLTELQEHDTGYKLYGQENTISGDFFSGKRWLSKEQFTALQRYELLPGDLVLTRKGSIGKCKIVPEKTQQGIADSDTIRVRLNHNRLLNDFGLLLLQDAMYIQRQIQSIQRGAILVGLNTATISNLRLAAPPPSEQKPILTRIQAETTGISSTMQAKSREIDLLHEYRTRLIADVVTGKLDVRKAAKGLPEDVEPPIQSDAAGYDGDEAEDDPDSDPIDTEED
jgi:type I restriction enzyme S subunit